MASALKEIYNRTFLESFCKDLKNVYPDFSETDFLTKVLDENWENLALKARMRHITLCLGDCLPKPYRAALAVLQRTSENLENRFEYLFFPDFVEVFGLDDWEASSVALEKFTVLCSSEFAVRPFIERYTPEMLALMQQWAQSDNEHVRRLASEGCRPRLPWGMALKQFQRDPQPILPILEALKDDSSEYVRRSVANNLNDISKDNPLLVLDLAERWLATADKNRTRIVKHALRTLLKKGDERAMRFFEFVAPDLVQITNLEIVPQTIRIGESLIFKFALQHAETEPLKLRLEYAIGYVKANGSRNRKVFQLTEAFFEPQKTYFFNKKQAFKDLTTRRHHAGRHSLTLIVNGIDKSVLEFDVLVEGS